MHDPADDTQDEKENAGDLALGGDVTAGKSTKKLGLDVVYCKVCTFPPEYCKFGATIAECKKWLLENNKDLFSKLYSVDEMSDAMKDLKVKSTRNQTSEPSAKLENGGNASAPPKKPKTTTIRAPIVIKKSDRSKKKAVTVIKGIDSYGIPLKVASKAMSSKFASGSSITKSATGQEEISIQGDISLQVKAFILSKWGDQITGSDVIIK